MSGGVCSGSGFIEEAKSIGQHETNNGTTYGEIESDQYNNDNSLNLFGFPTGEPYATAFEKHPGTGEDFPHIPERVD